MAIPSPVNDLLPTAWLAPPPGLLPSSHTTKIEPAFIATSVVLAIFVLVVLTLVFNMKKKGNFFDDVTRDTGLNYDHVSEVVSAVQQPNTVGVVERIHPGGQLDVDLDRDRAAPVQDTVAIPVIREPPRVQEQGGSVEDNADNSSFDYEDESTLVSRGSYTGNNNGALLSAVDLRHYPTSFVSSEFRPLPPEDVGMEGRVWKNA